MKTLLFILLFVYALINVFVSTKINQSAYASEKMRDFHKKLIWLLPFLGPLLIIKNWLNSPQREIPTNTKKQRDKNTKAASFYESEIGIDS